jgi:hypothetical protein
MGATWSWLPLCPALPGLRAAGRTVANAPRRLARPLQDALSSIPRIDLACTSRSCVWTLRSASRTQTCRQYLVVTPGAGYLAAPQLKPGNSPSATPTVPPGPPHAKAHGPPSASRLRVTAGHRSSGARGPPSRTSTRTISSQTRTASVTASPGSADRLCCTLFPGNSLTSNTATSCTSAPGRAPRPRMRASRTRPARRHALPDHGHERTRLRPARPRRDTGVAGRTRHARPAQRRTSSPEYSAQNGPSVAVREIADGVHRPS